MQWNEVKCVHKSSVFSATDPPLYTRRQWCWNLWKKNPNIFLRREKGKTGKWWKTKQQKSISVLPPSRVWVPKSFLPCWWILNSLINSSVSTLQSVCSKVASRYCTGVIKWLLDHWVPGLNSFDPVHLSESPFRMRRTKRRERWELSFSSKGIASVDQWQLFFSLIFFPVFRCGSIS